MSQGSINHEKETQVSPALVRRLFCSETGACGSHVCPVLGARRRVILIGFWDSVRTPNVFSPPHVRVSLTLVFFFFILKTLDAIWMVDRVSE